jgi:very-short-patch-repair endonuclease
MTHEALSLLNFKGHNIRIYGTTDEPWFLVKDVGEVLGIVNHRDLISTLDEDQKDKITLIDTIGRRQKMSVINKEGLKKCLGRCRKVDETLIKELCEAFNIKTDIIRVERVETAYLQDIIDALPSSIQSIREFKIGTYRIDLYLPKYKIAIECDEYNHKSYEPNKQLERDKFIKEQLGSEFVRFNPNVQGFRVVNVIRDILNKILI